MPQGDKSALTYALLMNSATKAGHWQQTRTLLDEMKAKGITPSTGCYNTVINAYGKAGLLEDALALFREMPKEGVQPDRITYTAIIDACARRAEADLALAFLEEMEEGPNAVGPSIVAYGSAINACAKALQGKQALALVHQMQERGLEVNELIYTAAIDALNKSEDDDTALLELYEQMKAKGFTLLKANCGAALKACERKEAPDKMIEIGHELVTASNGIIYPRALKQLLFAAEQTGKYKDGLFFYRQALAEKVAPTGVATKVALNCADKLGDLMMLRVCLKEARKAEGRVDGWMVKVALAAVERAQAEAEDKEKQTGKPMSKRKADAIERLRALSSSLWAEEIERKKSSGRWTYLGKKEKTNLGDLKRKAQKWRK
jgi:pentatricopeptide repeat protein